MSHQKLRDRFGLGAVAGLAATLPMTGVMEVYRRVVPPGRPDPFIPRQVAEGIARIGRFERHVNAIGEPGWWGLTAASHFGFGGVAGALYGLAQPLVSQDASGIGRSTTGANHGRPLGRTLGQGSGFGLLIWAAHYLGLFPALGILKPMANKPVRKNVGLILSHLAWGITTALLFERLARDPRRADPPQSTVPVTRTSATASVAERT